MDSVPVVPEIDAVLTQLERNLIALEKERQQKLAELMARIRERRLQEIKQSLIPPNA